MKIVIDFRSFRWLQTGFETGSKRQAVIVARFEIFGKVIEVFLENFMESFLGPALAILRRSVQLLAFLTQASSVLGGIHSHGPGFSTFGQRQTI